MYHFCLLAKNRTNNLDMSEILLNFVKIMTLEYVLGNRLTCGSSMYFFVL